MDDARRDDRDLLDELTQATQALGKLASDRGIFQEALDSWRKGDQATFQGILDRLGLLPQCRIVCDWICSKDTVLRCFELCGPPPVDLAAGPDIREFADVIARLSADEGALKAIVAAVEARDAREFGAIMEKLQLQRFCHVVCHWVLYFRCGISCGLVCEPPERPVDLFTELRLSGEAVAKLAANPNALAQLAKLAQAEACEEVRKILFEAGLADRCYYICGWICSWRCLLACLPLCRAFPIDKIDSSDDEIFAFAQALQKLSERPDVLPTLMDAVRRGNADRFGAIVKQFDLGRFCVQLCHWLCYLRCRRFCLCICPSLTGSIDTPAVGACAGATAVPACTSSAGPLVGIAITGTADGGGFDHYTLHYSWGGNPPVDTAVVYPDCSRPPAATGSSTAVAGGTLGYLDVTLLPPGETAFTVYLDVYDAGAGHVSDSRSFGIQTRAIQITAVAEVDALDAEDPFHLGSFIRLIKDTNDPSPTVPEQSVGGTFTVDGSAYLIGCDRIMSQFVLARFDAPPASTVPTPADASLGVPLIAAVPYEDILSHPWQSGCIGAITPNVILNGDLVAKWSVQNCTFLGTPYSVPKVKGDSWTSNPLNGRFVILLEVRDRPLPAGTFPGTVAGTDQVAVWIDNWTPVAQITSIGGISGCGDLHLKDYVGTTAEIRGVAWDPPIDATAPRQRPNENFGSYSLSYKKDGELATLVIPGATPNTRVPNVWPTLPAGMDGTLANWNIVGAVDYTGPGPTPPGMLARGERCAFVINLSASDTTHVGDGGSANAAGPFPYAINVINDIP